VLVVGADPLARGGLVALLARRGEVEDVEIAGEAAPDGIAAAAAALRPDVVLWDLGHAGAEPGPDRAALAEAPSPVVALAEAEAAGADALRAGARGLLLRGASADAIAAAVVAAAQGLAVLDGALGPGWLRPPEATGPGEGLTAREREVLALLAEGLANKAIAARLGISEHTAKFHVNAILAKLGAGSRAEAIVRAVRLGLVAL
jgi:DNA-binding NarL/FixJ family response regulator